jgi:hypothetical protein
MQLTQQDCEELWRIFNVDFKNVPYVMESTQECIFKKMNDLTICIILLLFQLNSFLFNLIPYPNGTLQSITFHCPTSIYCDVHAAGLTGQQRKNALPWQQTCTQQCQGRVFFVVCSEVFSLRSNPRLHIYTPDTSQN